MSGYGSVLIRRGRLNAGCKSEPPGGLIAKPNRSGLGQGQGQQPGERRLRHHRQSHSINLVERTVGGDAKLPTSSAHYTAQLTQRLHCMPACI